MVGLQLPWYVTPSGLTTRFVYNAIIISSLRDFHVASDKPKGLVSELWDILIAEARGAPFQRKLYPHRGSPKGFNMNKSRTLNQ